MEDHFSLLDKKERGKEGKKERREGRREERREGQLSGLVSCIRAILSYFLLIIAFIPTMFGDGMVMTGNPLPLSAIYDTISLVIYQLKYIFICKR